jgi:hypothetical protein
VSLGRFCTGLYRFFTWPFRKIYECFKGKEVEVGSPDVFSPTESVTSPRSPEAKLSPRVYMRRKMQKEKEQELQGKVHFKPLFLPDHFSASSDSKNDAEFKSNKEQERRRQERIRARKAIMKVLERMEEIDRIDKEVFERQEKLKKKKEHKPTSAIPDNT